MNAESKKKLLSWLSLTLGIVLIFSLGWGYYEFRALKEYKTETENQYSRAFTDLVTSLNEVETSIAKAKVAGSAAQRVLYLGETWKGSESAVSRLGQLPADEVGISYVDTFINQVSDFSKAMTRKTAAAAVMSDEEQATLNEMHERVIEINRSVQQVYNQFNSENLAWVDKPKGLLQKIGLGKSIQTAAQGDENSEKNNQQNQQAAAQTPTSVRGGLKQLDVSLQKYPPFSYQGELDKHYVNKPLGLPGGEINESKAIEVGKRFLEDLGQTGAVPQLSGLSENPLGGFNLTYKTSYLEVSKKGGVVTFYQDQRELGDRQLDVNKAINIAKASLSRIGWDLVVTSSQDIGSYIMVDAVPRENGALLYPDKIRLTIATDNGQIIGFDANPYYAYHHKRELNRVLTLEQAKVKLRKEFKIIEVKMAVISKAGTNEAFCYEFRGTAFGEEYMVYINALNGTEEKISRVVDTPAGKLIQ
ncbi:MULTISPECIES: PepSY1/2 domain-containing protein [unclassified Dehalobacter]|uniref:PepSY1/2 domain-containing protein n=1 Tax=unclassified Dehalobacter TaxID=2635733 RepID=UPI000E6C2F83|nr:MULTISPECIES: PepSY1/2 domain-containing protein [unclassified Dehalobacter]RJE47417.1 peptidase M4 [Dehalobacter sp. MCB1]TCX48773.1 peptidase M4 [Dehalobacter sp. 14DCB1]TCX56179.1 peptidase M4 [Dehalobacter sp. 12DCB1]